MLNRLWCWITGTEVTKAQEARDKYGATSRVTGQWGDEWWEYYNYTCGLDADDFMVLAQYENRFAFELKLATLVGYETWSMQGKRLTLKDGVKFYNTMRDVKHKPKPKTALWYC